MQSGTDGPLRVVAMCDGRAEDRHHRVADELLQHAAVLLDPPPGFAVVELEDLAHVLRVSSVGSRREADEVHEQDGHELSLLARRGALEARTAGVAEARAGRVLLAAGGAPAEG